MRPAEWEVRERRARRTQERGGFQALSPTGKVLAMIPVVLVLVIVVVVLPEIFYSGPKRTRQALQYCGSQPTADCRVRATQASEDCFWDTGRLRGGRYSQMRKHESYDQCMEKHLPGWSRFAR